MKTTKTVILASHKNVIGTLTTEDVTGLIRGTVFTLVCAAISADPIQMIALDTAAAEEKAPSKERTRKLSTSTKRARKAAKAGASVEEVAALLKAGGHLESKAKAIATVTAFGPGLRKAEPVTQYPVSVPAHVPAGPVDVPVIPVTNEKGDIAESTPPCVVCGKPTLPGVNSDFCSEVCEKAFGHKERAPKAKRAAKAKAAKEADVVATVAGDSHVLPAGVRISPPASEPAQAILVPMDEEGRPGFVITDEVEGTVSVHVPHAKEAPAVKPEPTAEERKARALAARAKIAALKARTMAKA
jgi:hypothetical protein